MFHVKHKHLHSSVFKKSLNLIEKGSVQIRGLPIDIIPLITNNNRTHRFMFIIDTKSFWQAYESIAFDDNKVFAVPPFTKNDTGFLTLADRLLIETSAAISTKIKGVTFFVSSCRLEDRLFHKDAIVLKINKNTTYTKVVSFLKKEGYEHRDAVKQVGEFSIRGSIVDFYSPNHQSPIRVNFFDGVDIGFFSKDNQIVYKHTNNEDAISINRGGGPTSINDIIENFLVFSYKNFALSPLKKYKESININIKAIKYDQYIEMPKKTDAVLFTNSSINGFIKKEQLYVPTWFVKKEVSVDLYSQSPTISKTDWEKGDFLIHQDFGICRYEGLTFSRSGLKEMVLLSFSDATVKVSIEKFNMLFYYAKTLKNGVSLSKLNKVGLWKRTLKRGEGLAKEYVSSVQKNILERTKTPGLSIKIEQDIEKELIDSFKYTDTQGQISAWSNIKKELKDPVPMDHLLCGDVGFGKTEVAIRASFATVLSGYKVIVVAPTTLLADQLYTSFKERLDSFGVDVSIISGATNNPTNTSVVKKFHSNLSNVLISTHKILFIKDLYENVGLIVFDEEHRFGVEQKDFLKNKYISSNFLFMTATPIPRSLYLSLSGMRSMSLISSPPVNRRPIITQSINSNISSFSTPILHEIARGGQVFIVYNNIDKMDAFTQKLSTLFNFATFSFINSSLQKTKINKTMCSFKAGKIDVLVASVIIESGLDLPNVNTMIIYNSGSFGLSQLYQLRGRIGRSSVQAYCYLSISNKSFLTTDSKERLRAIIANTSLGSNYAIAKSDLEIRGPGSLFGYKQSGSLNKIGFDLYGKLLIDALQIQKNSTSISLSSVIIDTQKPPLIPESFISAESIRVGIYNRIKNIKNRKDSHLLIKHLVSRFGVVPKDLLTLIEFHVIKITCASIGIYKIVFKDSFCTLFFVALTSPVYDFLCANISFFFASNITVVREGASSVKINTNNNVDIPSKIGALLNKLHYEKFAN